MSEETKEKQTAKEETGEEKGKYVFDVRRYFFIGLTVFLTFVCCVLFFFIIYRFEGFSDGWKKLLNAGQPIIIGVLLAYVLNPIMKFFERRMTIPWTKKIQNVEKRKKTARGIAVAITVVVFILFIAVLVAMIIPAVGTSLTSLIDTMPAQASGFVKNMQEGKLGNTELTGYLSVALTESVAFAEKWLKETFLPEIQVYVSRVTSGVFSVLKGLLNFIIGIIVMVYVMMIQETLQGQAKKIVYAIFKPKVGNVIVHTVRKSSEIFGGFITGKLLDSAIVGVICYLGCLILHIPNSLLVSVIIGVTNIVPFFGPIFGAVPCVILVIIQSPWHALYLVIFILVLQQVDGNIIGPKILGDSTGLSSFWVMFSILVFGGIWGFPGMVLGVPMFAVIYYIIGKIVRYGLRKRNLPDATKEYIKARGVYEDTNTIRYEKIPATQHELEHQSKPPFWKKIGKKKQESSDKKE